MRDLARKTADMLAADAQLSKQQHAEIWQRGYDACAVSVTEAQQVAVPQEPCTDERPCLPCYTGQGACTAQKPGWQWVPVELTVPMFEVAYSDNAGERRWDLHEMWKDQLAAAPQPPQAERVPMTDAEIDSITDFHWGKQPGIMYRAYRAFARAVNSTT